MQILENGGSNNCVQIYAPAKVNLFLEVLGKRADGYHDIYSLFQAVSLCDRLTCERTDKTGADLTVAGADGLSTGPDNLVAKSYAMMAEEFGFDGGIKIRLEKNIPIAAGLGGGSADGAAAILACNRLFDLGLDYHTMARLALRIGSDLPFFFSSGQALVTGRGENIEEAEYPMDYEMILASPDLAVSTAASYAGLRMGLTKREAASTFLACRNVNDFLESLRLSGNDFERSHFESYPVLGRIRDTLIAVGASLVRMSGSGPTVFGIFERGPGTRFDDVLGRQEWKWHSVAPVVLPMDV